MQETIVSITNNFLLDNKLVATIVIVVLGLTIRRVVAAHFKRLPDDDNGLARRWINSSKNAINFLMVVGLFIVWMSELRFVALSIATFVVALVIATREFIQCFVGSLYKTSTRTFNIGDWIKVNNVYGEVVASNWLSTTLLEVDVENKSYVYTGRTLVIPNNQFVANTVQNLNYMRRYVAHSFTLVRDPEPVNLVNLKAKLLEKAHEYCEPFKTVAERYNSLIESRLGANVPGPEPSVGLSTSNLGKSQLTITVFCPTDQCAVIEQKLTEDFFSLWHQMLDDHEKNKAEKAKANE